MARKDLAGWGLLIGFVGIVLTAHAALGAWPAAWLAEKLGISVTVALAACLLCSALAGVLVFLGIQWAARKRARPLRPPVDGPAVTAPPMTEIPGGPDAKFLVPAFYRSFRWLNGVTRITLNEIVREKTISRASRKHHRRALQLVRKRVLERREELFQAADLVGGEWVAYAQAFAQATDCLCSAIMALSGLCGSSKKAMFEAAGWLYQLVDSVRLVNRKLSKKEKDLRKVTETTAIA